MRISFKMVRRGLTLLGLLGVPVTSWLSVRCHEKAKNAETKKEKLKCYIPAIVSGVATGGCIIGSHRASSKEIAALTATATYAVANRNKLEEKFGPYISKEDAKEIKTEVAKGSIPTSNETHKKQSVEWTGHGRMRVLEGYSGRLFYSSLESVMDAENRLNQHFRNGEYVCLNDFYRYLGIQETHFGDQWGWVPNDDWYPHWYDDNPLCFENNIVEGDDGMPLLVIDLYTYPMEDWKEL